MKTSSDLIDSSDSIFLVTRKTAIKRWANIPIFKKTISKSSYIFSDFSINPKIEDVQLGVSCYLKYKPDLIVAIGGGTTLDIAKLISILANYHSSKYRQLITSKHFFTSKSCKVLAIPTTSGSGAETTGFAAVYIDKIKYSIDTEQIQPDTFLLDYNFVMTMPKRVAAYTAIDALCHSIESYWSISANSTSRRFATKSLQLISKFMITSVLEPNNYNRFAMAKAANYAGKAINITRTTAPHAFSYYLTSHHNISHGEAVGIMMNYILKYHNDFGGQSINKDMYEIAKILNLDDCNQLSAYMDKILKQLELKSYIDHKWTQDLIQEVNIERLSNHPVNINKDIFIKVLSQREL